jgi:signal transduction histidine kinase
MENRSIMSVLYRPAWLPASVTAGLLVAALGLLVGLSWYSREQLRPVVGHMAQLNRLQSAGLRLQGLLAAHLRTSGPIDPLERDAIQKELQAILALDSHLVGETPAILQRARAALDALAENPREALILTLTEIRKVLAAETHAHDILLQEVYRTEELEFDIALGALVTLPLIAFVVLALVRRHILSPLGDLSRFMTLLSGREYREAPVQGVDPMLKPLFERYNELVCRLARLEREHQTRQRSLEDEVRLATGTLLGQQRRLADAERLAAVGELAARVAHELRNPLAGMQMALNNLRSDISDPDHAQRLGLVIGELNRVFSLLNDLLERARREPEASREVDIAATVGEVLQLVGYQLPGGIVLERDIPDGLICRLPENGLRQALLNLVLNADQALGEGAGTIRVRARRDSDRIMLEVQDDGPGFPESLRDGRIRPFASARPDGTGLGLAVVRRFVADLGGALQITNLKPRGACVSLRLPCPPAHHG